jgi:zinc protease
VIFALPGMLRSDPDFIPAYVANDILGGGDFSSRLTSEVREKRGLTYDISTELDTFRRAGIVFGDVATRRESVNQTIAVVKDVLKNFAANGATDQELADAKTYLTGSFPLSFASNSGIASQLGIFQREGLTPDYIAKRNDLIQAVTAEDIRRVAKRLFDPARLTIVIAGTPVSAAAKPHR